MLGTSIDVLITDVGLILTKPGRFFSRGMDKRPHMETGQHTKNFDSKLKISD